MGKYSTPRVPIQTPMFDEAGLVTRTWVIFFERLGLWKTAEVKEGEGEGQAAGQIIYANFGVLGPLAVGNGVTTPVDLSIPAGRKAQCLFARANLRTASTSGNVSVTLEYSTNAHDTPAGSRTWTDVFAAGVAVVILANQQQMDEPVAEFSGDPLVFDAAEVTPQLRLNVDAAGTGAQGLNVSLAMVLV